MAEFIPINTQEEFNEAVHDRLKRERAKFADYDELKKVAEGAKATEDGLKAKIAEYESAKAEYESKIGELTKTVSDKEKEVESAHASAMRITIAAQAGVPIEFADRIKGNNEEEIRADAETIAAMLHRGAPGKNPETPPAEDGVSAAFRKLNPKLKF